MAARWRARAVIKPGQRHERFDGGAGRILAAQGAVVERRIGRVVQRVPGLGVDAVDEQVGVVAGLADEGQHFAVGGIDRHQRAAIIAERLLRHFLQFRIQRQHQVVAGLRRGARQHAHGASAGIHFDLLEAGGAVQFFS